MAAERSGKRRRRRRRSSRILPLTIRRGAGRATLPGALPPGVGRVIGIVVLTALASPVVYLVLAEALLERGDSAGLELVVAMVSVPIAFGLVVSPWRVVERFVESRRRILYDRGRERASDRRYASAADGRPGASAGET